MSGFSLRPVTPHCGALVEGVDLAQDDGPDYAALAVALAHHGVLFFRDQQLTPPRLKELGRRFGPLHLHPAWPRLVEGHPEVMEIYTDEHSTRIAGEDWHTDVSCEAKPPLGTLLYITETPAVGGDTLFASMYAAYEALSAPLKGLLEGLTAVHDGERVYRRGYDQSPAPGQTYPRAEHPLVRTHPVTGRKGLFVNRTFTERIVQLTPPESRSVLDLLFAHIEQPQFHCRFNWRPGSVAFWDNRCVQHRALWDYYPHRRCGLRVTIEGDAPYC